MGALRPICRLGLFPDKLWSFDEHVLRFGVVTSRVQSNHPSTLETTRRNCPRVARYVETKSRASTWQINLLRGRIESSLCRKWKDLRLPRVSPLELDPERWLTDNKQMEINIDHSRPRKHTLPGSSGSREPQKHQESWEHGDFPTTLQEAFWQRFLGHQEAHAFVAR